MKETASSQISFSSSRYTCTASVFYPSLCACLPRSRRATSIKHHDRGITLVFGSDGQVSLIGFGGGITSQPLQVPSASAAGSTGALTSSTRSLSSEPTSIPNLEATSASLTTTSSFTPTSTITSVTSLLTATDTDTTLPSIPTVDYPTPSPTAVSNPKDHGVGAPFYLAIVLASISFIGCVAAFIAWWIRSRARKHDVELDDPWNHRDSISDSGSPSTDELEKGAHAATETQTRPYYLPASIVRRSSSNLLAVPHTVPTLEEGTSQHSIPRTALVAGHSPSSRRANDPHPHNLSSQPNPRQDVPSSQSTDLHSRPGAARLRTGLSVQESTRTLGRLRVANRVPGDVTSGDEGGINISRLQNSAGPSPVGNTGGLDTAPVGENAIQSTQFDRSHRSVEEGDYPLEPPGPATLSWGRRTDTVAALRRTRRRTPETTARTYKNAKYGGYWYPTLEGGPSGTTWQAPENGKVLARPPLDPLGWTNTLKSSFWQAVDAMTGSRSSDPEPREGNAGSGSRFTPAPQRVTSRRPSISPTTTYSLQDARTARSQEADTKYGLTLPDKSVVTQETPRNSTRSTSGSPLTRTNESNALHISEDTTGRIDSLTPKVSHLNRDLSTSTNRQHPDSLRTDTGSMYSTDSAVARANLRKYGYGDSIPSSWSALGESRESQLDLARTYLPLPRPIRSSRPGGLPITPSQLTLESDPQSGSMSTRTRTPMHSKSDVMASDDSRSRSGKDTNTASYVDTTTGSIYSMSRNDTIQSGRSTIGLETAPLQASSTTSSMLNRKKGVTTRRKRPRPPPRAPSTASSVQSMESGLSIREVAVRRALLERRKKVKAAGSLKDHEDDLMRRRDAGSLLV